MRNCNVTAPMVKPFIVESRWGTAYHSVILPCVYSWSLPILALPNFRYHIMILQHLEDSNPKYCYFL